MELRLPLVVHRKGPRLVEAWVPSLLPYVRAAGPSLAELRDELALRVMERFETAGVGDFHAYEFSPHASIVHVDVKTVAHDKVRRRRVELEGRIAVLVQHVGQGNEARVLVTPTRLPEARFLARSTQDLAAVLSERLGRFCLERGRETLEDVATERRERLEILEVDAEPKSPYARTVRVSHGAPSSAHDDDEFAVRERETDAQREERRRRQRAQIKTLRQAARNLSHVAADGALDRCFGREALVSTLLDELDGRTGAAIVLVGPSGVGKTALVHELVRRLEARASANATRRDVWRIDGNRFIAGMMYVGQWEARARDMVRELVALDDVLYADDLASLVYAGRTSAENTNVAQYLEPHLARRELTLVAECTPERFELVRQEAPTFASLFRVVRVEPMTPAQTVPVLLGALRATEEAPDQRVARCTPAAIEALLFSTERFLANEALPGKAVRLLNATLASTSGHWSTHARRYDASHVLQTLQKRTGLPPFVLGLQQARPRDHVLREVRAMIAGQPEAVDAVTDVVIAMQQGLCDPEKPLATYLFVGPTGVGKTETAKALAKYLFGSKDRMVRFDMSEFTSGASIARLVGWPGAPDGELTSALRTQPFCVVLLDEIEKAHPRVFDALLQLLGEGRLTDAAGRTADARQAVLIMTSNLGVREAAARTGFLRGDVDEARKHYVSAAQKFFRPEFFNRIDRVVPFRSLGPDALRAVLENALADLLARRGIRRGNVLVDVEEPLLDLLVDQAFDPRYGARPLRRALERKLAVPLAHFLVRRRTRDAVLVRLRRAGDEMTLSVTSLREAKRLGRSGDSTAWGPAEVLAQIEAVRARLDGLRVGAAYAWLEEQRHEVLEQLGRSASETEAKSAVSTTSAIELLERVWWVRDTLRELEETELAEVSYSEQSVARDETDVHRYGDGWRSGRNRGVKGLRPRSTFVEVPVRAPTEAMAKRVAGQVASLRDQLDVLEYQVNAAYAARGDEAITVLLSYVTPDHYPDAMNTLLWAVPNVGLRVSQRWDEVFVGGSREPRWMETGLRVAVPSVSRVRRSCVVLEGAGVRAWAAHLEGYALLNSGSAESLRQVLLRVRSCEGAGGLAAVAMLEALDDEGLTVTVRARREKNLYRVEHVATTIAANATTEVLAAVLRARDAQGAPHDERDGGDEGAHDDPEVSEEPEGGAGARELDGAPRDDDRR